MNQPQPLDLNSLTHDELGAIHAALRLYSRDLKKEATNLKNLAKMEAAGQLDGEALGLDEEVIEVGTGAILYQHHLPAIRKGLEILARVATSSKGINGSIEEPESVVRSEAKATMVKEILIPRFAEQPGLGLEQ